MKRKVVYELHADEYKSIRLYYFDEETGIAEIIEPSTYDEVSKKLDCSTDLLETLFMMKTDINEYKTAIRKDIVDLYKKIEELEKKIVG